MPRLRRTLPACGLAIVALGVQATVADAAWTPGTDPADASTGLAGLDLGSPPDVGAVVAGGPGVAAVVGLNEDNDRQQVATHGPNGPWRSAGTFGSDSDRVGATGAVATPAEDGSAIAVTRVNPDGTRTDLPAITDPGDVEVPAVEALPDGTALVATTDENGKLTLWHHAPGAPGWTPRTPAGDAATGVVALAPAAGGRIQAVWTEVNDDVLTTAVRGVAYGPALPAADQPDLLGAPLGLSSVDELVAVTGAATPSAVWTQVPDDGGDEDEGDEDDSPPAPTNAYVGVGGKVVGKPLTNLEADSAASGLDAIATSDGGVAATLSVDDAKQVAGVTSDGTVCLEPVDGITASDLVRRGDETVLVGIAGGPDGADDGTLRDRTVASGCALGDETTTPVPGTSDIDAVVAATDGEGSIVAAVKTEAGAVVRVDDRTAPSVGTVTVPAETRDPNAPISATPSDSWGIGELGWTIDDSRVYANTARTTLPDATAGSHRIRFVATDQAGNQADATRRTRILGKGGSGVLPPPPAGGGGGGTGGGGGGTTTSAKPPRVRILSFRRTSRGWVVRVRARGAAKLRISVYRAPYLKGTPGARRRLTCPATGRRLPRPPVGLRGRKTIVVNKGEFQVRLTGRQAKALRRRGRYVLRVAGIRKAPSNAISRVSSRRVTVC